jgi:hypothetical protein
MEYLKATLWMILIIGILAAIALAVYELTKAGSSLGSVLTSVKNWISPPDPVMGPELQKFVNEPANQPGGYKPWVPTVEVDESYPPSWLTK